MRFVGMSSRRDRERRWDRERCVGSVMRRACDAMRCVAMRCAVRCGAGGMRGCADADARREEERLTGTRTGTTRTDRGFGSVGRRALGDASGENLCDV